MFTRALVYGKEGLPRQTRAGDGLLANVTPVGQSADSGQVIPAAAFAGGLYVRSGMTAARTDTTDTAANILAQFPNMDIGDSFLVLVSVTVAYALTIAAGAGVTLGTKTSIAASSFGILRVVRTGAATVTVEVL